MTRRVLLLADNPYFGGVSAHLLAVLGAFRERTDVECALAVLPGSSGDRTLIDACGQGGFTVHELTMRSRFDAGVLRRLRRLVRDGGFELVHTHGYRGTAIAALARLGVPLVGTSHGVAVEPALRTRLWQRFHMKRLARMAAVVAVSGHVAHWLVEQGVPRDRITVVHNGFDPPAEGPTLGRRTLGIPDDAMIVMYCGRLVPGKGLSFLVEAATEIPEAQLLFVGEGPERDGLARQAAELKVPAVFTGQVADPFPHYRMADVIALPSAMEALPSVLIEAASQKRPVIATDAGGIPEVVRHEETGLLVPYGDVGALRAALDRIADPTRRIRYGNGAYIRWKNTFTPEAMASGLATVYERALGAPK